MPSPECFEFCPRIVECRERLMVEMETPSASSPERAAEQLDALVNATARVALADCTGPLVGQRTIEKGGYFGSKKPVQCEVYVCAEDGYTQQTAFYYEQDKMPR